MKRLVQLLTLLTCATPAFAQERDFLGQWDITGTGKHADYVYWLEVKKEGDVLTGYFLNRGGSVLKLPSIKIEAGELVFDVQGRPGGPKQTHRVKAEADKLMGTLTTDKETIQWIGVRSPRWATLTRMPNTGLARRLNCSMEIAWMRGTFSIRASHPAGACPRGR